MAIFICRAQYPDPWRPVEIIHELGSHSSTSPDAGFGGNTVKGFDDWLQVPHVPAMDNTWKFVDKNEVIILNIELL